MESVSVWEKAKEIQMQTSSEIVGGFDMGFDTKIPEETKDALTRFAYWIEDHYPMPVTLWVDFKYNHYLLNQDKKRVPYKFYWVDFTDYPAFEREADIPVIELPVRTERASAAQILASFAAAVTHYFAWLCNLHSGDYLPDKTEVDHILSQYQNG